MSNMDRQTIFDELEALSGIFCVDGEFEVQSMSEKEIVLRIQPQQTRNYLVSLSIVLDPRTYPVASPHLSVQVLIHYCIIKLVYLAHYVLLEFSVPSWAEYNCKISTAKFSKRLAN